MSDPAPKVPRRRRPLRDAIGAVVYCERPGDPERVERIKSVLHSGAPRAGKLLRWLAGGGLGVWLALWGVSERGPWGLLNRWLTRTWEQTDSLIVEVKTITPALKEVAATNQQIVDRIDLLIDRKAADEARDEIEKGRRRFKATPVGPASGGGRR